MILLPDAPPSRASLPADARGWQFLGTASLATAAQAGAVVSWSGAFEQLWFEVYISGYSGTAVARLMPSSSTTFATAATTFVTSAVNYSVASGAPGAVTTTGASNGTTGVNGWNTGAAAIVGARYQWFHVKNRASDRKLMCAEGFNTGANAISVLSAPQPDVLSGLWNNTTDSIQAVQLWSSQLFTGNASGANISAGSYILAYGRNMD